MRSVMKTFALFLLLAPVACSKAPPCSYQGHTGVHANAGCLIIHEQRLLVVEDRQGRYAPPGGSSEAKEMAQCTAERETWEETGLTVRAGDLIQTFDNGFHLFGCHMVEALVGEQALDGSQRPWRWEVRALHWLNGADLHYKPWRFPQQKPLLEQQLILQQQVGLKDEGL